MDVIELGRHIIIQRKSQMSLHELPKKQGKTWNIKLGRNQVDLTSAVGKPYGAFKLTAGSKKVFTLEPIDNIIALKLELLKDVSSGESNQEIWDDGTSQQLKKEDLDMLREKGVSGTEIISHLVENSKTFQNRTEFSQEKYVNKKEEKYSECMEILKPSMRLLAKHFYAQDPMKVLNLRNDTLAMIMSLADVRAGGKYGVVDGGCQGLITASILDRLQGTGNVWNLYPKGKPQKQAVEAMDFSEEIMKSLQNFSLHKLKETFNNDKEETEETPAKIPRLDEEASELQKSRLQVGSLDGLVIASRKPDNLCKELLRLVRPSGNFVLYCPYIEPLTDAYSSLRENGLAVNLKLIELWCRNYQVLPMRTHPEVMMSGSGGYLLSGIHVVPT